MTDHHKMGSYSPLNTEGAKTCITVSPRLDI